MKIFAQIDKNIVSQIIILDKAEPEKWIESRLGGQWIEAFKDGGIRKNYPVKGYTYDSDLDAFIPPKPFESWVLDEETAQWEAPVEYPTDGKVYRWDEGTISWVEVEVD